MKKILSLICLSMFMFLQLSLQVFAFGNHDDYIKVQTNPNHLRSRLSKEYTGYIYTIKNISEDPINIESISTKDTLTGTAASLSVQRSSLATGAKTIGTGLVYAFPTLFISVFGSVIVAPVKMICNSFGNVGAKQEGRRYDVPASAQQLSAGGQIKIKTLGVHFHKPTVTILYRVNDSQDLCTLEVN